MGIEDVLESELRRRCRAACFGNLDNVGTALFPHAGASSGGPETRHALSVSQFFIHDMHNPPPPNNLPNRGRIRSQSFFFTMWAVGHGQYLTISATGREPGWLPSRAHRRPCSTGQRKIKTLCVEPVAWGGGTDQACG